MSSEKLTLGEIILKYRIKRGLSQEALAKKASVHVMTIHNMENNRTKPMPLVLKSVGEALNINLDEFKGGE